MNTGNIKSLILKNSFIDKLRIEMKFDDKEYKELCDLLNNLINTTKDDKTIDKELMLTLYYTPQAVRNMFLSFSSDGITNKELVSQLEDAWIELDQLILDLLA